jgi:hypothetical protein
MTGRERVWRLDVIGQGREPERESRLPLSRRWRVVAGAVAMLAVGAVLAVTGVGHRHGTGAPTGTGATPGAGVAGAMLVTGTASAPPKTPTQVFIPGGTRVLVVCSPATGSCLRRNVIIGGNPSPAR